MLFTKIFVVDIVLSYLELQILHYLSTSQYAELEVVKKSTSTPKKTV